MMMSTHFATTGSKLVGRAVGRAPERKKISRWVKFTYRVFFKSGESKYLTRCIAQLEGQTNTDTIDYLLKDFRNNLGYSDDVVKYRLISVDGEKVNREIE